MGAGAARTDFEQAAIDISDRSAARAHGVNVQHGRLDRIAMNDGLAGQAAFAAAQQRDIGGGSAHVESDEIRITGEPADLSRADDTGRGAGQNGANRQPFRLLETDHAAIRLGQMRPGANAQAREAARQAGGYSRA